MFTDAIHRATTSSRDWPSDAREVIHVSNVLTEDVAKAAAAELDRTELWRNEWYVADATKGTVNKVDHDKFLEAAESRAQSDAVRYSSVRTITPVRLGGLELTSTIRDALLESQMTEQLSSTLGVQVEPATGGNAALYSRGDFLRPHSDEYDGWVASLILYLSPESWTPDAGGRLALSSDGQVSYSAPTHNTLVLIPLRAGNHHWVEPITTDYRRMSLTVHLRRR